MGVIVVPTPAAEEEGVEVIPVPINILEIVIRKVVVREQAINGVQMEAIV